MDNCFSESKHSTQVYLKEQLNQNPESSISSNNDVDFKMESTIETITKRKHDVNNTSKANNDSNNNNSHNKNKEHVSNTNTSSKKRVKIRIITRVRRMKNHRKNENGNKKRKKHRWIKTPVTERKTKYIYNGG